MNTIALIQTAALLGCASLSSCYYDPSLGGGVAVASYDPGYVVPTLPRGYRSEVIADTRYYYHNGTYYRARGDNYVVVDRPRRSRWGARDADRDGIPNRHDRYPHYNPGRVVNTLPDGYTVVRRDEGRYYRYRDTYFRPRPQGGYIVVDL